MRLYCIEESFSNETEEVFGIDTSIYLPSKIIKIDMGKYLFIIYNFYECQEPDKEFNMFLNLCIVDYNFNLSDSIIVYKDDGYNPHIRGFLNPRNGKILLLNSILKGGLTDMYRAYIYEVNEGKLRFEILKEDSLDKNTDTSNLITVLEKLDWEEYFLAE
jgi:hypothetical protein